MSTVTVTVTPDGVTVKGLKGGAVQAALGELDAWTGAIVDGDGAVRLLAIARAGETPTVQHYTENGHDAFPDWQIDDVEPAVTVIHTPGDARLED